MILPRLPLPDSAETLALRAVVAVLRTDPTLESVVRSWCVWDGSDADLLDRTKAGYPHVAVTPQPGSTSWAEESQHQSNLILAIEMFVAGTNADDSMNLWGAIRRALFPPLGSARRAVVAAKLGPLVVNGELVGQPFQFADPSGAAENQVSYGRGELRLLILAET